MWVQEGERSYSKFKVRRGSGEEIPLIQGKEQQLHFAGAAVKSEDDCFLAGKRRQTQIVC